MLRNVDLTGEIVQIKQIKESLSDVKPHAAIPVVCCQEGRKIT